MDLVERYRGCLLGLALGDALGAPFEGWSTEQTDWRPYSPRQSGSLLRYTDDTAMMIGCAACLIEHRGLEVDAMAKRWADDADPNRGYGPAVLRTLEGIRSGQHWSEAAHIVFPDGSFGNGAAMRVAPLALFYREEKTRDEAVVAASRVTHAHRLAIDGARIIAAGVTSALEGAPGQDLLHPPDGLYAREYAVQFQIARGLVEHGVPDHRRVAEQLGHGIESHRSVVASLVIASCFLDRPFEDLIGYIISLGGDVDTIAAMSSAIWGASQGAAALPVESLARLEDRDLIDQLAVRLVEHGIGLEEHR